MEDSNANVCVYECYTGGTLEEAHPGDFIEVEHGRHERFLDASIVGGPWG